MTKEELLEDVNIGNIVKIHTESNEIFEGKITDFGESGLKIHMLNSNKAKRIMYGRIIEYDIEEEDSSASFSTVVVTQTTEEKMNIEYNGNKEDKSHDYSEENLPIVEEKNLLDLDRKEIFSEWDSNIDLEVIKSEWIRKLDSKQKNEYIRISNILDYAKKVHEYSFDGDRVKRAIAEYKKIAIDIKIINVFIALIYHEFNEISTAIEYYKKAGAHDIAFLLSLKYNNNENLFEQAILAVEYNTENEVIVKWLCEYAVKNNDFAVISHVINHCDASLGKVLLFWYADKPEIKLLPNNKEILANANILFLKNLIVETKEENDAHIKTILSNASTTLNSDEEIDLLSDESVYQGVISYYNKNGGNGMIKNLEGGSIYFYIKQVKDLELQRILATETDYKRKVVYTRGINFKGEIAADAIEMVSNDSEIVQETEYVYKGFLDDYDVYENRGKIRSGNKSFNFVFEAIKDPLLYAEIMSRPYSVLDLSVKFNARIHKSKKTKKVSWIAYDICGTKEYSKAEIEEFISQRYVMEAEVNEWLGVETSVKNVGYFRAIEYEPL
ncbi:MAG: hypothetical protein ACI4VF_09470, partial [Lachnospirales bacterium]